MDTRRAELEQTAKQEDCQYGFFTGGDPRMFSPDEQDCTPEEIAAHKAACDLWDKADAEGRSMNPEEPAGKWLLSDEGQKLAHILTARFGIGVQRYPTDDALAARDELARIPA